MQCSGRLQQCSDAGLARASNVHGAQALEEALAPRLSISGEMAVLEDFKAMFLGRTMAEGSTVALLWSPQEDSVDVALLGPCDIADMKQVRAPQCSTPPATQVLLRRHRADSCWVCRADRMGRMGNLRAGAVRSVLGVAAGGARQALQVGGAVPRAARGVAGRARRHPGRARVLCAGRRAADRDGRDGAGGVEAGRAGHRQAMTAGGALEVAMSMAAVVVGVFAVRGPAWT